MILIRTFDSFRRLSARTKRLQMKIVVFPLNCLILMEQGTEVTFDTKYFLKSHHIYITYHVCH